jgi:hypothetical protein
MVNILNKTPQREHWGVIKIIRIYLCSVVIVFIGAMEIILLDLSMYSGFLQKTDRQAITEILLKVALSTITLLPIT